MLSNLRSKLTYANVAATLALLFSLSGSAYALTIKSSQIANGAVKNVDLAEGSVGSTQIIDKTIRTVDVSPKARSTAYFDAHFASQGLSNTYYGDPASTIAEITLPAGKYLFDATGQFSYPDNVTQDPDDNIIADDAYVFCYIGPEPDPQSEVETYEIYLPQVRSPSDVAALQDIRTLSGTRTIYLRCAATTEFTGQVSVADLVFTATRVEELRG